MKMDNYLTYVIGIVFILLITFYYFSSWKFYDIREHKYFFIKPLPLIGTCHVYARYVKQFGWPDMHIHFKKKYGSIYGNILVTNVELTVHDSEIIRKVLFKDFNYFPNRRYTPFFGILQKSLLLNEHAEWSRQRKLLTPAFSYGKLKEVTPSIILCASKTVQKVAEFAQTNDAFEIKALTGGFTMDVISSSQFGLDIDVQNTDNNLFIKHAKDIADFRSSEFLIAMGFLFPWLCRWIEQIFGLRLAVHSFDTAVFFKTIIRKILSRENLSKEIRPNIISILKSSQNLDSSIHLDSQQVLSEEEIVSNAALFISAGYDTTANTLSFLLYNFAVYSEVQDKVLHEINNVFGNESDINYEKITQLKYLDMCINETLRMYPPVLVTTRVCLKDCKYEDVEIRKGWTVLIPIRAIHMDPDKWSKPYEFDPERFSSHSKIERDPTHFIPFGAGPRNCIGIRLAFLEMKILVVELLRKIRFVTCDETAIPLRLDPRIGLLAPLNGIWLKAELRMDNSISD